MIKRFESLSNEQPYFISDNGELIRTIDNKANVWMTDEQYEKIKDFANSVKDLCATLDEKKRLEVLRLKLVIKEIKKK